MANTYRTRYQLIAVDGTPVTGQWIPGPTVAGRSTTARTAAQKSSQWVNTTMNLRTTQYIVHTVNAADAADTFTQPVTVILDH